MQAQKLDVTDSPGEKKLILNSVKCFSLEGLNDLIRILMENVDDAMFELSDKVDNDRERNMYFEAMREIRLKREGIQRHFKFEMQQCFTRFSSGKTATQEPENEDEGELTLLEFDDHEDNIAIENMIARARPSFENDLFAVTERLKLVARRKEIKEDENPLDPKAICDCFHRASDLLETDIQIKLIFYKLFEKYVMSNLGHLYGELNELFIEKSVLPDFKVDQERMKQTTRFMSNRIKQTPDNTAANSSLAAVGAAENAGIASGSTDNGNLFAALQQAVEAAPGGGISASSATPGGAESVVLSDVQAASFVAALTTLQNTSVPTQPLTAIDPKNYRAETHQQLATFMQQNQGHVSSADSQTIDVVSMLFDFFFDDEALPAPIKVLIGRLQIPMLKIAIIDKEFFNQKKHPARKLLDSISRASLGWSDGHGDEGPLVGKIEEVVNFLINEFDQDIGVFEEAFISFENFLNSEDDEIEKAEQVLQQQEQQKDDQISQAQEAAAALIFKLTNDRELSFEVTDFLETTWTSVLFNAYLSLGKSSNHWRNLKRISTTFVWTLIPKFSEAERVKIIKMIPSLLRALSKGMELVKISTDVQNRIFQMLAQEHAKIVKQTSKNIVTRVDDQTIWPADNGAEAFALAQGIDSGEALDFEISTNASGESETIENEVGDDSITIIDAAETSNVISDLDQFTTGVKQGHIKIDEEIVMASDDDDIFTLLEEGDAYLKQAKTMEIGSWVEFTESPSKTLVARMSWNSKVTGNIVFANRQGHKVRNMSISNFAIELREGRARRIESSSVFDRAIYTIMTKMQR